MREVEAKQREHYRLVDLSIEVDTARVLRGNDEISLPKLSFDLLVSMLRRAAWLGADLLSLPSLEPPPQGASADGPRSAEILTEAARALARIGAEAETYGTRVAVSAPRTGSPDLFRVSRSRTILSVP